MGICSSKKKLEVEEVSIIDEIMPAEFDKDSLEYNMLHLMNNVIIFLCKGFSREDVYLFSLITFRGFSGIDGSEDLLDRFIGAIDMTEDVDTRKLETHVRSNIVYKDGGYIIEDNISHNQFLCEAAILYQYNRDIFTTDELGEFLRKCHARMQDNALGVNNPQLTRMMDVLCKNVSGEIGAESQESALNDLLQASLDAQEFSQEEEKVEMLAPRDPLDAVLCDVVGGGLFGSDTKSPGSSPRSASSDRTTRSGRGVGL